ncbi:MAG: hypothetical protein ACRC1U_10795 [Vibrionaceae bacterium]
MAYTKLVLENPKTGQIRTAPVGFAWPLLFCSVLFLGFFPPLFRGDLKWAIIISIFACLTLGLSGFVFMFLYNKLYIKDLLADGYKVKSVGEGTIEQAGVKLGLSLPVAERRSEGGNDQHDHN